MEEKTRLHCYVACPGFKRREGEACEERQELGGQVQAVPGRDGQASGTGRSPFAKNENGLTCSTIIDIILSLLPRRNDNKLEDAEMNLTGRVAS